MAASHQVPTITPAVISPAKGHHPTMRLKNCGGTLVMRHSGMRVKNIIAAIADFILEVFGDRDFLKRIHLVDHSYGRFDDRVSTYCSRAFTQSHVKI